MPLEGFVDLVHADHLEVGQDVLARAEVEHLLRLGDAADRRAGHAATPEEQRTVLVSSSGPIWPTSTSVPSTSSSGM